jgi:hypothetical protein
MEYWYHMEFALLCVDYPNPIVPPTIPGKNSDCRGGRNRNGGDRNGVKIRLVYNRRSGRGQRKDIKSEGGQFLRELRGSVESLNIYRSTRDITITFQINGLALSNRQLSHFMGPQFSSHQVGTHGYYQNA